MSIELVCGTGQTQVRTCTSTVAVRSSFSQPQSHCVRSTLVLLVSLHMSSKRARVETLKECQEGNARIADELSTLRKEIRNACRRERYSHSLPKMIETAAKILWCRVQQEDHLTSFLRHRTGAPTADLKAWAASVYSWSSKASAEARADMASATKTPALQRAAVQVEKYCREQALHDWVVKLNVDKGISPTTGVLLGELSARSMACDSNKFAGQKSKYRSSLQYLRRWRSRWGVTLGKFAALDYEEPQDVQKKVFPVHTLDPN